MPHVPVTVMEPGAIVPEPAEESPRLCVAAEIADNENEFRIRLTVPGCDERRVRLRAAPRVIVVEGVLSAPLLTCGDRILRSEFGSRRLYRVIELPDQIVPDEVHAYVHNGLLTIVAEKATAPHARRRAATAMVHA